MRVAQVLAQPQAAAGFCRSQELISSAVAETWRLLWRAIAVGRRLQERGSAPGRQTVRPSLMLLACLELILPGKRLLGGGVNSFLVFVCLLICLSVCLFAFLPAIQGSARPGQLAPQEVLGRGARERPRY